MRILGFAPEHEWAATTYAKTGEGSNMQIRVIGLREETPLVRPAYEGLYQGGATMSFPIADLRAHEQRMLALGVESTMGVKEIEFTSPAGETYVSAEIVYKAPEFVFVMGVTTTGYLRAGWPDGPGNRDWRTGVLGALHRYGG